MTEMSQWNSDPIVKFTHLTDTAQAPTRAHDGDAGWDLYADETVSLSVGEWRTVKTGLAFDMESVKMAAMICPRSGYAAKYGVTVLNAPGIVDVGYRGEIKVILHNCSSDSFQVTKGDKIAQLVFTPVYHPRWVKVDDLTNDTDRGNNGFGSSGR